MTRAKKRRMTSTEFDTVRPLLKNISKERTEAARSALVEGETLAAIATRHGCSRQAINEVVGIFWDALTRFHEAQRTLEQGDLLLPPGWEKVTLVAPSYLVDRFRADIALAATPSHGEVERNAEE